MDNENFEHVRGILERHKSEILRKYRAVGVGIGQSKSVNRSHVIVVYLRSPEDQPPDPVALEGVPLQFEVTGEFKPLN
jgi:hypothetical protein